MRNNETGEFELVVGNQQLLSGFFIVVLLFAVVFAMGYVVGQNTPAAGQTGVGWRRREQCRKHRGGFAPAAGIAGAGSGIGRAAGAGCGRGPQPPTDAAPQPTTQPAPSRRSRPQPRSPPAPPPATGVGRVVRIAGRDRIWQVVAVKPEVAEAMRQTLKDKGFQVSLTPGPNNLTRVLVGPYDDTPSWARPRPIWKPPDSSPVRYKRD